MTEKPKNVGASVKAQLLSLARKRGDDYQLLLTRYANERLLYRLAVSPYASHFVLKGAALFTLWTGQPHRATRDIDLHGTGDPTEAHVRDVVSGVIAQAVEDDGVVFDSASLTVAPIREDQAYGGVRVTLVARIDSAQIRLQIDVGFGDIITPDAIPAEFPALLGFPAPHLLVYPRETAVAEKLEAIVQLGMANSRMNDFYDIVALATLFEFDGQPHLRASPPMPLHYTAVWAVAHGATRAYAEETSNERWDQCLVVTTPRETSDAVSRRGCSPPLGVSGFSQIA
jgi:hypothetical protein